MSTRSTTAAAYRSALPGASKLVTFLLMAYTAGMHILRGLGVEALLRAVGAETEPLAGRSTTRVGRVAQTTTVIAAVVIGVVAIIGIYIYDSVYTTMPNPANSELNSSTNAVTGGFGSAMEFVPVILIVLMSVVVIGAVQRLRG